MEHCSVPEKTEQCSVLRKRSMRAEPEVRRVPSAAHGNFVLRTPYIRTLALKKVSTSEPR
jgi:hypothetical protein